MYKKILVLSFIMFLGLQSMVSSAEQYPTAEKLLESAFNALVDGDLDSYIDKVVDNRYENIAEQREDYAEAFASGEFLLESFEILKSQRKTDDEYNITTKLFFSNGEITKEKHLLRRVNGEWMLILDDLNVREGEYELIKNADLDDVNYVSNNAETKDLIRPLSGISILNYNFFGRSTNSRFYSDGKFTPPSRGLILAVSSQAWDSPQSSTNNFIEYSVVNRRVLLGDVVYGSVEVRGNVSNQLYSLSIESRAVGVSGLQLRFVTNSSTNSTTWSGRGSLNW